jgi:hypothetical protein
LLCEYAPYFSHHLCSGSVFIIIRHARRADKQRRASIKKLPPLGVDPLLRIEARRASGSAAPSTGSLHGNGAAAPVEQHAPLTSRTSISERDLEDASAAFDASLVIEERGRRVGHAAASRQRRRSSAGAAPTAAAAAVAALSSDSCDDRAQGPVERSYGSALDASPRGTKPAGSSATRQTRHLHISPLRGGAAASVLPTPVHQSSDDGTSSYELSHRGEPTSPVAQRFSISGTAVPMLHLNPGGIPGQAPKQRRSSVGSPAAHARESPRRRTNPMLVTVAPHASGSRGATAAATALPSPDTFSYLSGGASVAGGSSRGGSGVAVTSTVLRDRLAAFFARHDPGRLQQASQLAGDVLGDAAAEAELLSKLQHQYGVPVPGSVKVVRSAAAPSPARQRDTPSSVAGPLLSATGRSTFTVSGAAQTSSFSPPRSTSAAAAKAGASIRPPTADSAAAKSPRRTAWANAGGASAASPRRAASAATRSPQRPIAAASAANSPARAGPPLRPALPLAAAAPPPLPPLPHIDNSGLLLAQQLQQVAQAHIAQAVQLQQAAQMFALQQQQQQQQQQQKAPPRAHPAPSPRAAASSSPKSPRLLATSPAVQSPPSAARPRSAATTPRQSPRVQQRSAAGLSPRIGGAVRTPDAPPAAASPGSNRSNRSGAAGHALLTPSPSSAAAAASASARGGTARSTHSVSEAIDSLAASARALRRSPRPTSEDGHPVPLPSGSPQLLPVVIAGQPEPASRGQSEPAAVAEPASRRVLGSARSPESDGADPTN